MLFSAPGPSEAPKRRQPKKCRWGPETEAGIRVLLEKNSEQAVFDETDHASKRRRSRWEPEESKKLPGLPEVALPKGLAHLVGLAIIIAGVVAISANDIMRLIEGGRFVGG